MNPQQLAANVLRTGKALAPDRFPAIPQGRDERSQEEAAFMLRAWAKVISEVNLPFQLWEDAVVLWASTRVGDKMCTPKDLIGAAYTVRDRWESDPDRRRVLEAHRVACQNRNYAKAGLEPITVADLPNHSPEPLRALHSPPGGKESASETHRRRVVDAFANRQGELPA